MSVIDRPLHNIPVASSLLFLCSAFRSLFRGTHVLSVVAWVHEPTNRGVTVTLDFRLTLTILSTGADDGEADLISASWPTVHGRRGRRRGS